MRPKLRVAAAQMHVTDDHLSNLRTILKLIDKAARMKCDIVCFPETSLIHRIGDYTDIARLLQTIQEKCRQRRIWGLIGSYERNHGQTRNCTYLIDDRGQLVYRYGKVHLYRTEVKEGIVPGRSIRVIRTRLGVLGIIICFDFAFPEFVRKLSRQGAEIIFCPSFMVDSDGWRQFIRAMPLVRAFENTAYFVLCDAVTDDNRTAAISLICDPRRILAYIEGRERLITAVLDMKLIRKMKRNYHGR